MIGEEGKWIMPIERLEGGGFIITGDSIKAVASLAALFNWRRNAVWMGKRKGNRPAAGMTVRKFNEVYKIPEASRACTWGDIYQITDDTIKALREGK